MDNTPNSTNQSSRARGSPVDTAFHFRVSLRDANPEDAFPIELPSHLSRLTIADLLNDVFPEEERERAELLAKADVRANPDLPELYIELVRAFDLWRDGDCTLRFFTDTREVGLVDRVADHLRTGSSINRDGVSLPVLDLAIEQRFEVLSWFEWQGGDKAELLQWLRSCTLLYFIDKHGFRLQVSTTDELERRTLPMADELESEGLAAPSDESGFYEITGDGRRFLGHLISETESYIEQYDVFNDVLYDVETLSVRFGTGHGEDLRVEVFKSEGIDPIRAVFLLRLYDSSLDAESDRWHERIHLDDFFDELLRPVLDHPRLGEDALGWIIESGFARNEEQAEEARRREVRERTLKRIRSK